MRRERERERKKKYGRARERERERREGDSKDVFFSDFISTFFNIIQN